MNPICAKCTKAVYPVEALKCIDQVWHKTCFKCATCGMTLNMKNYKGYDKRPYCNAHYPTTKFTAVADTPENIRLKQQSQMQSQIQYHKDFEETKGKYTAVADDPETLRMKELKEQISLVEYHKEFETTKGTKISTAIDPETERLLKNSQISSQAAYHGLREQRQQQERRRSELDYDDEAPYGVPSPPQSQSQQPYRRPPGKISDYDPMANQMPPPPPKENNTPYSSRGQARVVYSNSENTDFGTLIGFQKVQPAPAWKDTGAGAGAEPVELRHNSSSDQPRTADRISERSSGGSAMYDPPPPPPPEDDEDDDSTKPVFVPYQPEPREEKTPQKKPDVMKFRVNTGFEKLRLETRTENQNGQKAEDNNNRLSVDDKYNDDYEAQYSDIPVPDPYAPPDVVMPSNMPARSPTGRGPTPPPPTEGPPPNNYDSYEVQVQVKYQPEYNEHNDDSKTAAYPEHRERGYSSSAPYDPYSSPQRAYEDYDRPRAYPDSPHNGGQTNPAQMNYSQTLPRGDSRGRYHQDSERYDPRADPRNADLRSDPRNAELRSDPRNADPRGDPKNSDPRSDPRNYDPRSDPRYDPRMDPRYDPRGPDPRMDTRMDPRMDPRHDPRMDPRNDPRMQEPRYDPRLDPRHAPQQQSPRGYSTLPNRKGRAGPDPYNDDQYQAPRRIAVTRVAAHSPRGGSPRGSPRMTPASSTDSLSNLRKAKGEHGSQASLGSLDSGGSGTIRRQRKARQPYYRALYDYAAADDDEISFSEGDSIIDVVPIDQGWMEGRVKRTGAYGMLPANYVEFVQ